MDKERKKGNRILAICATLTLMCCVVLLTLECYWVFVKSCSWGAIDAVPIICLSLTGGVLSLILLSRHGTWRIGLALLCIAVIGLMMQEFVIEIHAKCLTEKRVAQSKAVILHLAVQIDALYHRTNQLPKNEQELEMLIRRAADGLVKKEYIMYTKNHEEEAYQLTVVVGLLSYMYDSRYPHQGVVPIID